MSLCFSNFFQIIIRFLNNKIMFCEENEIGSIFYVLEMKCFYEILEEISKIIKKNTSVS